MLRGKNWGRLACRVVALIGLISLSACVLTSVVTTQVDLSKSATAISQEAVRSEIEKFISNHEVKCIHSEIGGTCRFWDDEGALGTVVNYGHRDSSNEHYVSVRTSFGSYLPISDEKFENGSAIPEQHLIAEQWLTTIWGNPHDLSVTRTVSGRDIKIELRQPR